jgi:hypothetical protein
VSGNYKPELAQVGHACFKKWIFSHENHNLWSLANAICLNSFGSWLALVPYMVRSYRIKKMFQFREIYVQTGKMPRHDIHKWDESRITKNVVILLTIFSITVMDVHYQFRYTEYFDHPFDIGALF